ncbi:Acyl-CoA thioesterase FadM [Chitinophaga costaii]|uniref:Acyl-CoA thioesterase FadM n=1 Tax=Chitinophaga costaii TaxID=1335309 RepID=A0A1C3ZW30_9BACT|nr:thioesterase family protein [Chitinophaga costaii]PUZ30529.1 thioesterase [Chitinophaga costaii]SCB86589.1 Acyl-CoA thioesterase FadM [Chitinophaga costaii]
MARIKLVFPDKVLFSTTIPVRITDVNYGGHVGNDAILSMLHEVRVQFLQHLGSRMELDVFGTGIIMADVAIMYQAEGFYGDVFNIAVGVADLSAVGFDLMYRISTQRDQQTITIATAKTGILCFDYSIRKVAKVPAALAARLQ